MFWFPTKCSYHNNVLQSNFQHVRIFYCSSGILCWHSIEYSCHTMNCEQSALRHVIFIDIPPCPHSWLNDRTFIKSNTMDGTCVTGTAYHPDQFTLGFIGVRVAQSLVFCVMFCRSNSNSNTLLPLYSYCMWQK